VKPKVFLIQVKDGCLVVVVVVFEGKRELFISSYFGK
jgi:hypothetical protein